MQNSSLFGGHGAHPFNGKLQKKNTLFRNGKNRLLQKYDFLLLILKYHDGLNSSILSIIVFSLSRLFINIPERYTIGKVWPSDATTEDGYYNGTNTTYWSVGMRGDMECTQILAGGFPWSGV